MIPFDELCAALEAWRRDKGLGAAPADHTQETSLPPPPPTAGALREPTGEIDVDDILN
jgi:hypothetical protein